MCWPRWGVMSVTLSELSLRNARRQARDYLVYFVTVVLAAALLYAFNGLIFSPEVQTLSSGMKQLPTMIALASIVVVCIFGWLVAYATKFMLLRRSRELGTYLLIGLTNRQVARLFFLENLAVGGAALVIGLLLGGLMFQALWAIVLALFGRPYHFSLAFSLPAIPPVLIGVPFLWNLANAPEPGVMVGASGPPAIIAYALAVFFLIYAVYILLAYTSMK